MQSSVLAVLVLACGTAYSEHLFQQSQEPVAFSLDIGTQKQLFLDDALIVESSAVSTFQARPHKYVGNPILKGDRSWEKGGALSTGAAAFHGQAALYDEEEKLFKLWYYGAPAADGTCAFCYATSRDGYHWDKPTLRLVEFNGSKENNILALRKDFLPVNVIKTPHDPDPQRRYKALGEVEPLAQAPECHGVGVSFSPDGIRWTDYANNPVVAKGPNFSDGSMILGWDKRIKKYVAYFRPGWPIYPRWPGADSIRTIGYSESEDFISWTPTRLMLVPDDDDRADSQYHHINVAHEGEWYIGLLPIMQTHDMTWEIFLLTSRDGFRWTWVDRGRPFIGRGEIGSYDAGYVSASAPIVHDDKVWIYYGAYSGSHSFAPSNPASGLEPVGRATVALATLPVDRYAGLLAGPRPAVAVTRSLRFRGSQMTIDCDASLPGSTISLDHPQAAQIRVAILDSHGTEIAGFGAAQCNPISTSGLHEVSWSGGGDLNRLQGEWIRVRFEWRHAVLYSFQFKERS